jgi:hypothetical protein
VPQLIDEQRKIIKRYFLPTHVLLHLLDESDGHVFTTTQTSTAFLDDDALKDLEKDTSAYFSREAATQRVIILAGKPKGHNALAQLELTEGSVAAYVDSLTERIGREKNKRLMIKARGKPMWVIGVAPNWLSGGAPQVIGTGGPGEPPRRLPLGAPHPAGFDTQRLDVRATELRDELAAKEPMPQAHPVHVFVLDTLPGPRPANIRNVGAATTLPESVVAGIGEDGFGMAWGQTAYPGQFPGMARAPIVPSDCDADLTRFWADQADLDALAKEDYRVEHHDYDMSDHGLFVASIIKQIAPLVHIHLVQVLNEFGLGSTTMMAAGFAEVQRFRDKCENAICIVNCSFTLAVPILKPEAASNRKQAALPHNSDDLEREIWCLLKDPDWSGAKALFDAIVNLNHEKSRVVAAAGNDSPKDGSGICAARYPARLEAVLGVGALDTNGKRATYSNYPDAPDSGGIMTLGTMRGLFTGFFPINPEPPSVMDIAPGDGFADWSGTSFASPVVVGALAKLVSVFGLPLDKAESCLRSSEATIDSATNEEVVTVKQLM